jgi:hypothetical protein
MVLVIILESNDMMNDGGGFVRLEQLAQTASRRAVLYFKFCSCRWFDFILLSLSGQRELVYVTALIQTVCKPKHKFVPVSHSCS